MSTKYSPKIKGRLPAPTFSTDCQPPWSVLWDYLQRDFVFEIAEDYKGVNFVYIGNDDPPQGFRGAWVRTDAIGKPLSIRVRYNGTYVDVPNLPLGSVVLMPQNTPQKPPWYKADGTNGTINLTSSPLYNPAPNLFLHQLIGY